MDTEQASVMHQATKSTIFVDVRPEEEYAAGHIPGAVNRRIASISQYSLDPELARYRRIIVYGDNPGSAAAMAVAKRLIEAGHGDVTFYEPGLDSWKAAGLPVEKSK